MVCPESGLNIASGECALIHFEGIFCLPVPGNSPRLRQAPPTSLLPLQNNQRHAANKSTDATSPIRYWHCDMRGSGSGDTRIDTIANDVPGDTARRNAAHEQYIDGSYYGQGFSQASSRLSVRTAPLPGV